MFLFLFFISNFYFYIASRQFNQKLQKYCNYVASNKRFFCHTRKIAIRCIAQQQAARTQVA